MGVGPLRGSNRRSNTNPVIPLVPHQRTFPRWGTLLIWLIWLQRLIELTYDLPTPMGGAIKRAPTYNPTALSLYSTYMAGVATITSFKGLKN